MERKHYVKRCKLIIADRYWLASHFFAADSSGLAIWIVSCLSQVIGKGGAVARIHVGGYADMYTTTGEYICVRERRGWEDGRGQNGID